MTARTALVIVISPDAQVRAQMASEVAGGESVVVVARSVEQAGGLIAGLDATTRLGVDVDAEAEPVADVGNRTPRPVHGLVIDRRRFEVSFHGVRVDVTPHEFDLLELLATDPGRIWEHEELHQSVWRTASLGNHGDLDATVKRLRRKLRLAAIPHTIEAVRGFGYRLLLDVEGPPTTHGTVLASPAG